MDKPTILKQQLKLGLMLLLGVVLLTWAAGQLAPEPLTQWIFAPQQEAPFVPNVPVIGTEDVVFTPPPEFAPPPDRPRLQPISQEYAATLADFGYLTSRIFLADPETMLLPGDIDVPAFLAADLTIDTTVEGPTVLIFHTHSTEMFIDSNPAEPMTGIMGTGRYLAQVLAENHGLETLHYTGRFDMIGDRPQIMGSYERMEPVIRQILADNPSIQVVIDLHRDGVGPNAPAFVRYVNEKPTAQIMFFNGLSRQNRNGQPVTVYRLPNPYQRENLNFSFQMQLAANQLYPGLARRVYLRAFRYSLHMMPLSTLVEVGNQHNTREQANNAMYPLANIIAAVVLGNPEP